MKVQHYNFDQKIISDDNLKKIGQLEKLMKLVAAKPVTVILTSYWVVTHSTVTSISPPLRLPELALLKLQTWLGVSGCAESKATLNVGDNVWVVQKTKRTAGVIEKVNIKRAIVNMQGSNYNVPLSMIEVA